MFADCYNLKTLEISTWNTSAVKNMSEMFAGCHHLETLDLSTWNTSSVTDMSKMFGRYPTYNKYKKISL
ncbi:MAG: BspA family leucine-rich repeat surface protein [Allobaculum sp.]|nr:BspA family leucine-rich repeat surface protein [Allobaculum sp.]